MKKQYIPHQAPERLGEQMSVGGEEPISDAEEMVQYGEAKDIDDDRSG